MKYKTFDVILNEMLNYFYANQNKITDLSEGSIIRTMFESLSFELSKLYYELYLVNKNTSLSSAIGEYLDKLALEKGFVRLPASKSSGYVRFYKEDVNQDTYIASGTIVATKKTEWKDEIDYEVVNSVLISAGTEYADVYVRSIDAGEKTIALSGAVSILKTPVNNIKKVENLSIISGGSDEESDENFRSRILDFYYKFSQGLISTYEQLAYEYSADVLKAKIINRGTYTNKLKLFIIENDGIASDTLLNELKEHIKDKVMFGLDLDVITYEEIFIDINANVILQNGYTKDTILENGLTLEENIAKNLSDYLSYRRWYLGDNVEYAKIIENISKVRGVYDVDILQPTGDIVLSVYNPTTNKVQLPKLNNLTLNFS